MKPKRVSQAGGLRAPVISVGMGSLEAGGDTLDSCSTSVGRLSHSPATRILAIGVAAGYTPRKAIFERPPPLGSVLTRSFPPGSRPFTRGMRFPSRS